MKKLFAILLAVMMIAALAAPAFAAETVTITVTEPTDKNSVPETYTAYKLLSATKIGDIVNETNGDLVDGTNGITYYTDADTAALLGSYFTFVDGKVGDADVKVVKSSTITAGDQAAAAALLAIAKNPNNASKFASSNVTVGSATALDIGYYVVESSLGTQLIMLTTDQTIQQKNYYPSFTKAFAATPEGGTPDTNAAIDDTIEYVLTVTVPATVNQNVVIHDTLDAGLQYVSYSSETQGVTAVQNPENAQEITFTIPAAVIPANTAANQTVTVTINYSAKLTGAAVSGTEYKNVAYLTYSNFQSETQQTITKTNKLTVSKVDGGAEGKPFLPGATLQLQDASGNAISLVGSGNAYRLATAVEKAAFAAYDPETAKEGAEAPVAVVDTFVTGNAAIVIEGLDSDLAYKVAETQAPAGYNALTTAQDVAAEAGADRTSTIENFTGTVLPSTGGIGTTIFYVVGGALVLAAGVVLITKKRLAKEED